LTLIKGLRNTNLDSQTQRPGNLDKALKELRNPDHSTQNDYGIGNTGLDTDKELRNTNLDFQKQRPWKSDKALKVFRNTGHSTQTGAQEHKA
jgi:hypothetical protein